jgi:hypothetical protein
VTGSHHVILNRAVLGHADGYDVLAVGDFPGAGLKIECGDDDAAVGTHVLDAKGECFQLFRLDRPVLNRPRRRSRLRHPLVLIAAGVVV